METRKDGEQGTLSYRYLTFSDDQVAEKRGGRNLTCFGLHKVFCRAINSCRVVFRGKNVVPMPLAPLKVIKMEGALQVDLRGIQVRQQVPLRTYFLSPCSLTESSNSMTGFSQGSIQVYESTVPLLQNQLRRDEEERARVPTTCP